MICSRLVTCLSKFLNPYNLLFKFPKSFLSYNNGQIEIESSGSRIHLKAIENKLDQLPQKSSSLTNCVTRPNELTDYSRNVHRSASCESVSQIETTNNFCCYESTISDLFKELVQGDRTCVLNNVPKICKSEISICKTNEPDLKKPSTAPCRIDIHDSNVQEVCERAMQTCSEVRQMINHYVKSLENVQKITYEVEMEVASLTKGIRRPPTQERLNVARLASANSHGTRKQCGITNLDCMYCSKSFQVPKSYFCPCCRKRLIMCTCTKCPHCHKLRFKSQNKRTNNIDTILDFNKAKLKNSVQNSRNRSSEFSSKALNCSSRDSSYFNVPSSSNNVSPNTFINMNLFQNHDGDKSPLKLNTQSQMEEHFEVSWIDPALKVKPSPTKKIRKLDSLNTVTKLYTVEKQIIKKSGQKISSLNGIMDRKKTIDRKMVAAGKKTNKSLKASLIKETVECAGDSREDEKSYEKALMENSKSKIICKEEEDEEEDDILTDLPNAVRDLNGCELDEIEKYFKLYENREYLKHDKYTYFILEDYLKSCRLPQPSSKKK